MENKHDTYTQLLAQVRALTKGEDDGIALLANVAAAIHEALGTWWTGFYLWRGNALHLGPFQGPVACTRIPAGKGVCGTAYQQRRTIVVPDVERFSGHIACSSRSRSEIVVPLTATTGEVLGVLDIDSTELSTFDEVDAKGLEAVAQVVAECLEAATRY